jgi:hypothetical protein
MKKGNIASPWRYDAAAESTIAPTDARRRTLCSCAQLDRAAMISWIIWYQKVSV